MRKFNPETGERFTWSQGESLEELANPERIEQIKERTETSEGIKEKR